MKTNVTRLSCLALVTLIVEVPEVKRKGEFATVEETIFSIVDGMLLRQKAIDMLRIRMKKHYSSKVMDVLAALDAEFAVIFCTKHLKRTFQRHSQLTLPLHT